ncbi:1475_t:CDS:2 [Funneliformis geosporum]|uniref:1475_t:CDS:1 n=1 Tax=Funneliformis geosporum TaxID=1117311 RepID=A0A9W4ST44_9GLOM|nr:1475_t:CDS:2 [Funneliformis geosporum]
MIFHLRKLILLNPDIATHTKWTYPLTNRDSASVAIDFEKTFQFLKMSAYLA